MKTAEAAADPSLADLEWPVTVDGVDVVSTDAGGIEVVDVVTEDVWVAAGSPTMWDSTGVAEAFANDPVLSDADPADVGLSAKVAEQFGQQAEVEATVDGESVGLVPDATMLADADTVYPVYIDPVFRSTSRSAWTMVASAYPNEKYWAWTGDQGVGNCSIWSVPDAKCDKKRIFYRVPTSTYSGKTIISATFAATLRHNYYNANKAHYADLYLTGAISASTTWNNQPSGSKVATANTPAPSGSSCDYSAAHATEWNVKTQVANAASNGTSALTFGVRNANESDPTHWMRFCNNGHLRVTYNTPPSQPAMSDLRTSAGTCQWEIGAGSYTGKLPIVYAALKDADGDQLKAEFRFTDKNDNLLYSTLSSSWKDPGLEAQLNLATAPFPSIASGTEVRWEVRAWDGTSYSPWSSAGNPTRCRFIYDTTRPDPPTVTSTDLLGGDVLNPMVGEIGSLTIDSVSADVSSYTVRFNEAGMADQTYTAASLSAPVTVQFLPPRAGRFSFDISANDATGWSSTTSYSFRVSGTGASASWSLGEPVGATTANDAAGTNPGTVGSGVTFGQDGPGAETAAKFDGTSNAYISTSQFNVAPTGEGVSIAAWAKVDDLSKSGVVASIDGGLGEAGMILGYRSTSATTGHWYLSMPDMASGAFSSWEVVGGSVNTNTQSEWMQLVGVWNDFTGKMTLYIDGTVVASAVRESVWWGDGTVQIGRASDGGVWSGNFTGQIAGVHVFDRVVTADEALDLGFQAATRLGYWQFNDAGSDGTSPEFDGGRTARLEGDAYISDGDGLALNGSGHLALDGSGDHAWVDSPMVDTAKSFSLSARVKLDTAIPGRTMTVLSIPGTKASAIEVGYVYECDGDATTIEGCWQLRLTEKDAIGTSIVVHSVSSLVTPSDSIEGQSIAVVYDAITGQARLYVNGVVSEPLSGLSPTAWTASGELQIGRGFGSIEGGSGYRNYFSGVVDEVRAYEGVLTETQAGQLNFAFDEHPGI